MAVRIDEPWDEDDLAKVDLQRTTGWLNGAHRTNSLNDAVANEHRPLGQGR